MQDKRIVKLCLAGLLIAIGIIIPVFSPAKILLEPASYTLASHVAIFIAMFISPYMAGAVAVGTTMGFLFSGFFPPIVVFRAASHILFAFLGAFYLRKNKEIKTSMLHLRVFSFLIALFHAAMELVVVYVFYFGGFRDISDYRQGHISVLLLVGLGTVIHSMIDFEIANLVMLPLRKVKVLE